MDADLRIETLAVEKALDFLGEGAGHGIIKDELEKLANEAAGQSRTKAPAGIQIEVQDGSDDQSGFIAFLVGGTHPSDSTGKRVPRWLDKGTLGNARGVRKPGRRYSRAPGTGIRPRRFIRKVSKTRIAIAAGNGVAEAARRAGFDVSRWGG